MATPASNVFTLPGAQVSEERPLDGLDELAAELLRSKRAEADAKKHREGIEAQIIALAGAKEEGANTVKTDKFKVTTTGKLNRKLNLVEFDKIAAQIPTNLQPIKTTSKRELDVKGARYLEQNEPEVYAILAKCMDVSPAKTTVEVTALVVD